MYDFLDDPRRQFQYIYIRPRIPRTRNNKTLSAESLAFFIEVPFTYFSRQRCNDAFANQTFLKSVN